MDAEKMVRKVVGDAVPGTKFYLHPLDADEKPFGEPLECTVIQRLSTREGFPALLAHVGDTPDVTLLHFGADCLAGEGSTTVVTATGVCGSDAEVDYGYPEQMVSDRWAGYLFKVLD